jgi:phage shock protein A
MALITRVSRLFRADVNAVLDRVEEPEILLKQAVREMEEALDKDEQRLRLLGINLKQLDSRRSDIAQRLESVTEELDLCFMSNNEVLARNLLKSRLESERYLDYLRRTGEQQQDAYKALNARIDENRSRLESMRQKLELFSTPDMAKGQRGGMTETDFMGQFAVSEDDVELAFLREKQRRSQS